MSKKSKLRGVLLSVLAAVIAFALIAGVGTFCYYRFYIMPKYNSSAEQGKELESGDIFSFAKYFSDKQFLNNLKNFDKSTAPDVLEALTEIAEEEALAEEEPVLQTPVPQKKIDETVKATGSVAESTGNKSAYDRIMESADKEEIMQGMSIVSKVDIAKINALQKEGKTEELKSYIKSVLTPSEISVSLKLYNKYKHLL